jgi:hypothetical protein
MEVHTEFLSENLTENDHLGDNTKMDLKEIV